MQQDFLLVRKMQNGDEAAMDIFVQKYYPKILQYCGYLSFRNCVPTKTGL
ncbi:MAG: hypothetical protein K2J04_08125 [Lachnospiraceae bacterium]|nr:hypothetical protein [Lachnospiraceae bacterium]